MLKSFNSSALGFDKLWNDGQMFFAMLRRQIITLLIVQIIGLSVFIFVIKPDGVGGEVGLCIYKTYLQTVVTQMFNFRAELNCGEHRGFVTIRDFSRGGFYEPFVNAVNAFLLRTFLLSCLIYLIIPIWMLFAHLRNKGDLGDKILRGVGMIAPQKVKAFIEKNPILFKGYMFKLTDNVYLPESIATRNNLTIGRPGSGKSQLIYRVIEQLEKQKFRSIIHDLKGDMISNFYNEETDLIFNPVDKRMVRWSLFKELETIIDIQSFCSALIEEGKDPFWSNSAENLLKSILILCKYRNHTNYDFLWQYINTPNDELKAIFDETPNCEAGSKALSEGKMAASVMAVLATSVQALEYLNMTGVDRFRIKKEEAPEEMQDIEFKGFLRVSESLSYYTRGNYYFESKGEWHGKFAQNLGLSGEVGEEFFKILDGFNHQTGEKIVASAGAQEVKTEDGTVLRKGHCSGFDLTFSAPKAVSLLALKDSRIEKMFDEAVIEAMQYVEDNLTQTRTKRLEDGKAVFDKKQTSNLAWAKFNHQTSRATDPQLHSHCVVMNMTRETDTGKTKTLDWLMYGQNSKFVGQYFRNCLADKMQDLGYEIEVTDRKQGFFTIAGIGQEVEEQFSKRAVQVEEKAKELRKDEAYRNFTDAEISTVANLMSRGKKRKDLTMEDLKNDVEEQLAQVDTSLDGLVKSANQAAKTEPIFDDLDKVFEIAMRDITEQQAAFKKEELLMHCMKLGLGDYSGEEIMQKFEEKTKKREILAMPDEQGIFTTQKMIDIEKAVIDNCKNGIGQSQIKVDKEKALNFIEETHQKLVEKSGYGFTPGQRDAIELIASTDCQFSVIQGDAGTGKSFSMNFAREMLEADGFIVRGFAPTGKASVELSNSAKIKGCQTIDKFLIDGAIKSPVSHEEFLEARKEVDRLLPLLKSEGKNAQNLLKRFHLTRSEIEKMQDYQIEAKILKHDRKLNTDLSSPIKDKEVWVVDESGMAGSAKYLNVIEAAKRAGAKCIFVGDRKQFASIEAGRMFSEMQDKSRIDKVIMPDVFRQKTDQTKQIVKAISMREMDFAFDMMKGRTEIKEKLDDINSYQIGQMVYFHEDIKNRKGEVIAEAGSSAKVRKINENGTMDIGIYDSARNENVDTNFSLKKIADKISVYESIHENIISQEIDREKRLEKVVDDYMVNTARQVEANPEKLFETMIITATNKDRSSLNKKIRDEQRKCEIPEMKVSGDFEFPVLEANSLGGTAKSLADSYQIGNKIQVGFDFAKQYGIDDKQLGTISGIDTAKNKIIVEFAPKNKDLSPIEVEIDPSSEQFSAFRESVKPFGVNDKIVFLKNDNNINVRNGQLAIIKEIDEDGNVVADMSGEKVKFNLNEYRNIDHAYCLSEYKSQGATVSRLVWHADTKAGDVSSNSFYVAITRCTHEIALYTDNAKDLQEKVKRDQFKYSTVDVDFEGEGVEKQPEEKQKIFDIEKVDVSREFRRLEAKIETDNKLEI